MHIIHITQSLGGVNVYINNSMEICVKENNKSLFIVFAPKEFICKKNINVRVINWNPGRNINIVKDLIETIKLIWHLLFIPRNTIIHCHSAKAGVLGRIAGKLLGFKTIYTPHAFSFLSTKNSFNKIIYKFIEKSMSVFTDLILTTSESESNLAKKIEIPSNKIYTWTNSIYPIKNIKVNNKYNFPYICTVARPCYQKNLEMLVRVMALTVNKINVKCIILGIGYYAPQQKQLVELVENSNLSNKIILINWLSREDTLRIIFGSKLYISVSRYEGLPLSVIEAMGLGKACIATDVDGNRDCITNGITGILVPLNDDKRMAEGLIKILKNKTLRCRMEKAALQKFYSDFDLNINGKKLYNVYKGLVGNSSLNKKR